MNLKIILIMLLFLITFLLGCTTADPDPDPVEDEVMEQDDIVVDPDQPIEYFTGDSFSIEAETLTITDITSDGKIYLDLNNKEFILYGTNNPLKVGSTEVSATSIDINLPPQESSVFLKINKIELNENEYILDFNQKVTILGKQVTLTDVDTDSLDTIRVKVSLGLDTMTERINKGKTKIISDLKITNIRSNPRAVSTEKYAIVKIESDENPS